MDKKETFRRLRDLGDAACAGAQKLPAPEQRKLGAVNWGDLGVTEVLYCEDEDGASMWVVLIEEASPGSRLSSYVSDFIRAEMPDLPLEVRTEW